MSRLRFKRVRQKFKAPLNISTWLADETRKARLQAFRCRVRWNGKTFSFQKLPRYWIAGADVVGHPTTEITMTIEFFASSHLPDTKFAQPVG